MASQPVARAEENCSFTVQSYVRGYHIYMEQWEPRIGEVLPLEREPSNPEDKFAVAIKRCGSVVGHVPFNLAPVMSAFLKRPVNKGLVEVTGLKVNRGAGYGLEIPGNYHFYGSQPYIQKIRTLVEKLRSDGLL